MNFDEELEKIAKTVIQIIDNSDNDESYIRFSVFSRVHQSLEESSRIALYRYFVAGDCKIAIPPRTQAILLPSKYNINELAPEPNIGHNFSLQSTYALQESISAHFVRMTQREKEEIIKAALRSLISLQSSVRSS